MTEEEKKKASDEHNQFILIEKNRDLEVELKKRDKEIETLKATTSKRITELEKQSEAHLQVAQEFYVTKFFETRYSANEKQRTQLKKIFPLLMAGALILNDKDFKLSTPIKIENEEVHNFAGVVNAALELSKVFDPNYKANVLTKKSQVTDDFFQK